MKEGRVVGSSKDLLGIARTKADSRRQQEGDVEWEGKKSSGVIPKEKQCIIYATYLNYYIDTRKFRRTTNRPKNQTGFFKLAAQENQDKPPSAVTYHYLERQY